jgi:hypothetical protein
MRFHLASYQQRVSFVCALSPMFALIGLLPYPVLVELHLSRSFVSLPRFLLLRTPLDFQSFQHINATVFVPTPSWKVGVLFTFQMRPSARKRIYSLLFNNNHS